MTNPYTIVDKSKNNLKRNVWDWSHNFHFTTEIGRITPCFCQRLGAGQSLSIRATHAEQFMPMMFPVQNDIRSRMSFFKVPIRALWKDYMDYISSVNQVDADGNPVISKYEEPYIGIDSVGELAQKFNNFFGTCSTLDYLGLPTTYDESSPEPVSFSLKNNFRIFLFNRETDSSKLSGTYNQPTWYPPTGESNSYTLTKCFGFVIPSYSGFPVLDTFNIHLPVSGFPVNFFQTYITSPDKPVYLYASSFSVSGASTSELVVSSVKIPLQFYSGSAGVMLLKPADSVTQSDLDALSDAIVNQSFTHLFFGFPAPAANNNTITTPFGNSDNEDSFYTTIDFTPSAQDYAVGTCPWYNKTTKEGLKVSSYPLRALEAIYNAYFRYDRNNPLSVGGVKKYNDWVLCRDKGGNDSDNYAALQIDGEVSSLEYFYGRKYCNWEPDMFTTAVQSPQEGPAPLVGLTNYVVTSEENGVTTRRLSSVLTDEDGQSFNVSFKTDENGLTGVDYEATSVDEITGSPVTSRYQAVSQGVSIEDFRQVNAYQRYLELNMRRGYSYKDIIEGRFDVSVRYDELLMPEFCGGFTRNISVDAVTQTTPTDESGVYQGALGSQAGNAFGRGSNKGNIKIYCDEDSIVIGLIVIYPDPIYSQHLPKHFLYRDPLDIFNPEFANIGFQPIKNSEVAPIQVWNSDKTKINGTFGYQRPWYEMLSRVNEAHGLYRTQLRNFLMYRKFSGVPQLSKEFLLVHPNQVNDVFSVTETTDKIFGMIRFEIRAKNSIPRTNVPRIE